LGGAGGGGGRHICECILCVVVGIWDPFASIHSFSYRRKSAEVEMM
jgi:hypothetical protein